MQGIVIGCVGKIYQHKEVQGAFCLSFSVAEKIWIKEHMTTWYNVTYWGRRANMLYEKLNLSVGDTVSVRGQSYQTEYEGRTKLNIKTDWVEIIKRGKNNQNNQRISDEFEGVPF